MPSKSTEDKYAEYAPTTWGTRDFDFITPSGQKCLLRKMDPMDLIQMGLMDKLDFATGVVMNQHVKNSQMSNVERIKRERARREAKAKGEDPNAAEQEVFSDEAWESVIKDPSKLINFKEILDEVLTISVVAPKMVIAPKNDDDRVDGVFYTDTVPFNDKVAVFNVLMKGVKVVEQFRDGSEENVGAVAPKSGVRPAAKRRTPASRKRTTS